MDLADDIAYSVSDLEDFVRAGRIPFDALAMSSVYSSTEVKTQSASLPFESDERKQFLKAATEDISGKLHVATSSEIASAFNKLLGMLPIGKQYLGTDADRARLRRITGGLMNVYIKDAKLDANSEAKGYVTISRQTELEIALLKQLTWHYVINRPSLALQQESEKEIVRGLFDFFKRAAMTKKPSEMRFFPRSLVERLSGPPGDEGHVIRCIADFVAGMSDSEAAEMYQRLHGMSPRRQLGALRV
jgi:dGTPase